MKSAVKNFSSPGQCLRRIFSICVHLRHLRLKQTGDDADQRRNVYSVYFVVPIPTSSLPSSIPNASRFFPWSEPGCGQVLLEDIARLVNRFVTLLRWAADTVALWVLHTHGKGYTRTDFEEADRSM